jgi:hypothetical protein
MPGRMTASELLDREYLELRAKIVELAAGFDRLDRAEGSVEQDPRRELLRHGVQALQRTAPDRAEQVQLIFSRPYEPDWRQQFGLSAHE